MNVECSRNLASHPVEDLVQLQYCTNEDMGAPSTEEGAVVDTIPNLQVVVMRVAALGK